MLLKCHVDCSSVCMQCHGLIKWHFYVPLLLAAAALTQPCMPQVLLAALRALCLLWTLSLQAVVCGLFEAVVQVA